MANPDHVKELLKGVEHWNEWLYDQRKQDPSFRPDLIGFDIWSPEAQESVLVVKRKDTPEFFEGRTPSQFLCLVPDLQGIWLSGVILFGARLVGADLRGAHLEGANLSGVYLEEADLCGTHLEKANLSLAHLEKTDLSEAHLEGSHLSMTFLEGAYLRRAHLEKANLSLAHLEGVCLGQAHLEGANLWAAHLEGLDLRDAHLKGTVLRGADLRNCNVAGVRYNRRGPYRGIRLEGAYGSQRFLRHAKDQDFIEEFRDWDVDMRPWKWPWKRLLQWKTWRFWEWNWNPRTWRWRFFLLYLPWLIFADCGRGFLIWAGWSILLAFLFGCAYWGLGEGAFHASHLASTKSGAGSPGFLALLYYSIVTFTTLGFGDIVPKTGLAAFFVTLEVIFGYVMLGGLISIFANKLARRSG
ncbi:pentapeptide repeat-containing protein [Desulfocurvus sp. DL9XJH121]